MKKVRKTQISIELPEKLHKMAKMYSINMTQTAINALEQAVEKKKELYGEDE